MAAEQELKVTYYEAKDILLLTILPSRPAKVDENDFGFFTRFDWNNRTDIVGFEIMDFRARFIPHLYDPEAIPAVALAMRFSVEGGPQHADTHEVLEWAYRRFVVKKDLTQATTGS
jgi:hypothetical protein